MSDYQKRFLKAYEVTEHWHALLMACKPVSGAEADYAEYETNRQLSLDGNLPGELRDSYKRIATFAADRIISRICRGV